MWIAGNASAQSSACDQLKGTLSARIEASGVRDYALEAVPAATPTPANARVIGTCDGGRTKMLYRRGAAAQPLLAEHVPPAPPTAADPAPPASAASRSRAMKATKIDVVAEERAPVPVQAPTPTPTLMPVITPAVAPGLTPTPAPALQPAPQPRETAAPAPPEKDFVPTTSLPTASLVQQATDLAASYWKWLLALVLVPMAGWLWAWITYRRAYDKSGLPRGPRL